MRPRGNLAQTLDAILLVRVKVTLEPVPCARILLRTLPGEDMRRNPVEKPAVVARDDRATRKREQGLLETRQRLGIQVIGRLVEQEQVAALLERKCEIEAVALATREHCRRACSDPGP